jgi:hypothetical protein
MVTHLNLNPRFETDISMPFWHRDSPILSSFRLDPHFVRLRQNFPHSWRELLEVKHLIDGYSVIGASPSFSVTDQTDLFINIASRVAECLRRVAAVEGAQGRDRIVQAAESAAEVMAGFADTGEWGTFVVTPPAADQPWLYCGPLNSWAPRATRHALSLLVGEPDRERQSFIAEVDNALDLLRHTVQRVLGGPTRGESLIPEMYTTSLMLAGGESTFGHKNFAHFFPLETPGGRVIGADFTVVFTNVHRERLRQCSLPLLAAFQQAVGTAQRTGDKQCRVLLADVLRASLIWFRCHDLGHFWRRDLGEDIRNDTSVPASAFENMALEEAYADVLGLLCARQLVDDRILALAFGAEMLRYLSRSYRDFADSVAATLEIGWCLQHRLVTLPVGDPELDVYLPAAESLVRVLETALWGASGTEHPQLKKALAVGQEFVDRLEPLSTTVPTDLTYVCG